MARKSNGAVLIGVGLVGALYFFMTRKAAAATGAPSAGGGGMLAPSLSPGSQAITAGALAATNAIWGNLTATTGPPQGYVNFPSGSQAPAGLLQWATDGSGNYYTQWAGHIWLVPLLFDSQGNYTAGQQIS